MNGLFKKYTGLLFLFLYSLAAFGAASAQELNTTVNLGDLPLTIQLEPRDAGCKEKKQIKLNKMFCMAVMVTSTKPSPIKDLTLKVFDATMPGHGHGMVTRSKIRATKSGEYLIEGLKLHMPGEWNFKMELVRGKASVQVAIPLKL